MFSLVEDNKTGGEVGTFVDLENKTPRKNEKTERGERKWGGGLAMMMEKSSSTLKACLMENLAETE